MQNINMINLAAQQQLIRSNLDLAIAKLLDSNDYILGNQVIELEENLAKFCGAKYAISCANGTDALTLVLRAKQLTAKDVVFVPAFTFTATAEAVVLAGAIPIFVDVLAESFNLDPNSLEQAIVLAKKNHLNPVGIIPVDLFGLPASYEKLNQIAIENGLWILCDAAQSFGASYLDRKVGTLGLATATSFFPSKPLGCYGDGGCIFTDNLELAEILRSIRIHGASIHHGKIDKYNNVRIGTNSRLDTLQAVVLLEKLKIFSQELIARNKIAETYNNLLINLSELTLPTFDLSKTSSSWAQYTIKLNNERLNFNNQFVQTELSKKGISSMIYYPKPISEQQPYVQYPRVDLKISKKLANTVLSLPFHPYLAIEEQEYITENLSLILKS